MSAFFGGILLRLVDYVAPKLSVKYFLRKLEIKDPFVLIHQAEHIKTVWSPEEAKKISDFYYPSRLIFKEAAYNIKDISLFDKEKRVVIEGDTGQGKSVLMKYLYIDQLRKREKIPILIELRKITPALSLKDLVLEVLSSYQFKVTDEKLQALLKKGVLVLLLDAFDEIKESEKLPTLHWIESLSASPKTKIVITSRKNQDIQKSNYFTIMRLAHLTQKDIIPFLQKVFGDKNKIFFQFKEELYRDGHELLEIDFTPLLLTLLGISYKIHQNLPRTIIDFYDGLFNLLIERHDKIKPSFKREFATGLNTFELENYFGVICFQSISKELWALSLNDVQNIVSSYNKQVDRDFCWRLIEDIRINTSLIIQEGQRYVFIHKNLVEYQSAKFVKNSNLSVKRKLYDFLLKNYKKFEQTILFLSKIDEKDYQLLYLQPSIQLILSELKYDSEATCLAFDTSWIRKIHFIHNGWGSWSVSFGDSFLGSKCPLAFDDLILEKINSMIKYHHIQYNGRSISSGYGDYSYGFNPAEETRSIAFKDCDKFKELENILANSVAKWIDTSNEVLHRLREQERDEALFIQDL